MRRWQWNQAEHEALLQLNNARAVMLYMLGLRCHMDYTTGIVGVKRRVSLQMFRELLEERRDRGSKEPLFVPTDHAIRWLITVLEKAGLVERLPKERRTDPMLFRLLLADTGPVRSNEEPQRNRKGGTASEELDSARGSDNISGGSTAKEEPHTSGLSGNLSVSCNKYIYGQSQKFGQFGRYSELSRSWRVEAEVLDGLAVRYGFDGQFLELKAAEFRLYWLAERGDGAGNYWDQKFIRHIEHRLNRGDSEFLTAVAN